MRHEVREALRELWKAPEADPSEVARGKRIAVRAVWAAEHGDDEGPPCRRCWRPSEPHNYRHRYEPVEGW